MLRSPLSKVMGSDTTLWLGSSVTTGRGSEVEEDEDDWDSSRGCRILGIMYEDDIDVAAYCARADVDEDLVRAATRRLAEASSVAILEDLGIQMAPHSTLNSWLEKLIYLVTGNFAKQGGMNLHSSITPISTTVAATTTGATQFSLIDAKTKAIVINFPHNPTGEVLDKDTLKEISRVNCSSQN